MLEAAFDGGDRVRGAQDRLKLLEVRDECSFGDFANGMGYGCCTCEGFGACAGGC
jgi:hypothetical protein